VIWARAGAPRGGGRATLRVFCLPLIILSLVGCRTYDDYRYPWYDAGYGSYGHHRYRPAPPAPHVYQPVAPPVFVAPRPPPPLPPQQQIIVIRPPPERQREHHHRRDERPAPSRRDRGDHLNGSPDHKRGR
jgi:hypothetical protein